MTAYSETSVLVIGNFLSGHTGVRCVCEDLAERLSECGWNVLTASARATRLSRTVDMVRTAWNSRRDYRIAQVEVYSGKAFVWAEAVCFTLRLARKPYVLTLHGGCLPTFAARNARRVRRLLSSARVINRAIACAVAATRTQHVAEFFGIDAELVLDALPLPVWL